MPNTRQINQRVSILNSGHVATIQMHLTKVGDPPYSIPRAVWIELEKAFVRESANSNTRVILLRGAAPSDEKPHFGGGADFHELLQVTKKDSQNKNDRAAHDYWRLLDFVHLSIEQCSKPVIAVIEGYALGAAFALASSCDLRVADQRARIGIPAVDKGLTLGLRDTRRLVSKFGAAKTTELLMLGKLYSASEAYSLGLINYVADGDLETLLGKLTHSLVRVAPLALSEAKKNVVQAINNPGLTGVNDASWPIDWAHSRDTLEGISAFLEGRRDPQFQGR